MATATAVRARPRSLIQRPLLLLLLPRRKAGLWLKMIVLLAKYVFGLLVSLVSQRLSLLKVKKFG